jgi:hypothetical protein
VATDFNGMTTIEIQSAYHHAVAAAAEAHKILGSGTPCNACFFYTTQHDNVRFCKKWRAPLPDEVLRGGCEAWLYDDIPF